jgi:hypothetical protein
MVILNILGVLFGTVCFMIVAYMIIMKIIRSLINLRSGDVRTTQHESRWGYYFHDPHGNMVSYGGFLTETGALRAAQRERSKVAKELQEACGL